jgi:integrase
VDGLRSQGLSPSTIANILDPLRVIFRRAIRRDEVAVDPTENLDLPSIRGRRDRIEPPEKAHELLAAVPDTERAFWATALFCCLRRGELRGLQWTNVDFDAGVIRVDRRRAGPRAPRRLPHPAQTDTDCGARPENVETPDSTRFLEYRYRDSKTNFRRQRDSGEKASCPSSSLSGSYAGYSPSAIVP